MMTKTELLAVKQNLSHLESDWPTEIQNYKGMDQESLAQFCPDELIDLASQYFHRDNAAVELRKVLIQEKLNELSTVV
jgi:hypothetical protein